MKYSHLRKNARKNIYLLALIKGKCLLDFNVNKFLPC